MGTEVFPGSKVRPGSAIDHSSTSIAVVMKEYSYIFTHPLGHNGAHNGNTLPLPLPFLPAFKKTVCEADFHSHLELQLRMCGALPSVHTPQCGALFSTGRRFNFYYQLMHLLIKNTFTVYI